MTRPPSFSSAVSPTASVMVLQNMFYSSALPPPAPHTPRSLPLQRSKNAAVAPWCKGARTAVGQHGVPSEDHNLLPKHRTGVCGRTAQACTPTHTQAHTWSWQKKNKSKLKVARPMADFYIIDLGFIVASELKEKWPMTIDTQFKL